MIVDKKVKISVTDVVGLAVSLFFLVGITCWFDACGPKADGGYMNCHWAEKVVTALASVMTALSAVKILLPDGKMKTGVSIALSALGITAACVPQGIIPLCMMDSMVCHTQMRPWTAVFGAGVALVAAADCAFWLLRGKKK